MRPTSRIPAGLLLAVLLCPACDFGTDPPSTVFLSVLASADGDGPFTDTLGVFESAWGRPASLDDAQPLQFQAPSPGGFRFQVLLPEGDEGEVYVFIASRSESSARIGLTNLAANRRPASLGAGRHVADASEFAQSKAAADVRFDFRFFFIDGVGDLPSGPVEMPFVLFDEDGNPLPSEFSVWVDPEKHTLRPETILRIDLSDLTPRASEMLYGRYRVRYEPHEVLRPLLLWRDSREWLWEATSDSDGEFAASRYLTPIGEGFGLRIFTIDLREF